MLSKQLRNKYVSVVLDGNLIGWTGKNPDKFPESKKEALKMAKLRGGYAVVVEQILEEE